MNRDTLQRILDTLIRASSYYDTYDAIAELEAELAQKPVRCEQRLFMEEQEFYESPTQRQPLTDDEIATVLIPVRLTGAGYYVRLARAIEAAHGIKEQS